MSNKQTPREIIAKLAEMSDEEFSQFMAWHFARLCKQPLPADPELSSAYSKGET